MDLAVFSEIYIYCKYPNPGQSLSGFHGSTWRNGSITWEFGAWVWRVRQLGARVSWDLAAAEDRPTSKVASTASTFEDIVIRPESSHCVCWVQDWINRILCRFYLFTYKFVYFNTFNQNTVILTWFLYPCVVRSLSFLSKLTIYVPPRLGKLD